MTEPTAAETRPEQADAAWVTIETPFDAATLRAFLDDVERLFRINSLLSFDAWSHLGGDRYRMRVHNQSNGRTVETAFAVRADADRLIVTYADGLKTSTTFHIEATNDGPAKLVVTDDYSGADRAQREARTDEVDKSLNQWGRDLHRYLFLWKRWSGLPGWSFYMRRIWQPMRPMARRIAFMLIMITAVEFMMFLLVFALFWLEMDKYLF